MIKASIKRSFDKLLSFTGFANKTIPIMLNLEDIHRMRPTYVVLEIPKTLKVRSSLPGKVQKSGSSVRITLTLKRPEITFSLLSMHIGEATVPVQVFDGMHNLIATYHVQVSFIYDAYLPATETWY